MMFTVFRTSLAYAVRNRVWLAFSLLLPCLLFSLCVALAPGANPTTPSLPLLVLDAAHSPASQRLLASLRTDPTLIVSTNVARPTGANEIEQAERAVRDGQHLMAVVMLPDTAPGAPPLLKVFSSNAFAGADALLWTTLQQHAMRSLPDALAQWSTGYLQSWVGELEPAQLQTLAERRAQLARQSPEASWQDLQRMSGVVKVAIEGVSTSAGSPLVALYAAALGLMCLLFAGSNAGGSVLEEKYLGTLDRILSSRVSMRQLLLGKLLYAVTFGCVQFLLLFLWATLWFRLHLLEHLAGLLVVLLPTAVCCGAFGLMLSLRCRDRIVQGFVTFIVIVLLSLLGGGIVPRIFMSETLQNLSLVTFNAWAIEGFTKVFWNQAGVLQLWPQVGALLGFAILFMLLARRFAQRWEFSTLRR